MKRKVIIDKQNSVVIPFEYKLLSRFYGDKMIYTDSDTAIARKNNFKTGVIDIKNQILIPFEYEAIDGYLDGKAAVCKKNETD